MSKHLVRETELLTDQRGSLAYVSPEILSGKYNVTFYVVIVFVVVKVTTLITYCLTQITRA